MKRFLIISTLMLLSWASFAQSGTDFPQFGNEFLTLENKIEIYPNPSTDYLNITIHNSTLENTKLLIHNIIGSKYEVAIVKKDIDTYQIDVRDLPPGYYLLSIKDPGEDFNQTFKFLKR